MLAEALFTLVGVVFGTITGLIPGMHINTLAAILIGFFYKYEFPGLPLAYFVIGLSVANSFSGFIPSIFLGAPDESTVLSVAPGHRMLKRGKGYEALALTVLGGIGGFCALIILLPILAYAVPAIYEALRQYMQYILIIAAAFLIHKEKRILWAVFLFCLSSAFGIASMNANINSSFLLLPVLSGLFGLSTLAVSYFSDSRIPKQRTKFRIRYKKYIPAMFLGLFSGIIAGLLPGIGTSQSAIIAQETGKAKGKRKFMAVLGSISVTDTMLSVIAIYLIGNPRSGGAIAIQDFLGGDMAFNDVILFTAAGLLSALIAAYFTLRLGQVFGTLVSHVNYRHVATLTAVFLLGVIYAFSGALGILIALTGMAIGIIPHLVGVKKSLLLGCLITPTVLYFLGISIYF